MPSKSIKKRHTTIWIYPIIILAFALRLYRLDAQSLWFDEIVIVALARMSWYEGFVAALGQGMQLTPVFHGIIKLWMLIGDTDWLLRVPAVLFSVLSIPLIFKIGCFYFGDNVGLLAAFIFAINPFQVWYAQELKLYALLPVIAMGAMYGFGVMVQSQGKRGLGLLILFNLVGLSAHYFMFLISSVQFLYIIVTFKRTYNLLKPWTVAQIIGVFPLSLWWLFILSQQFFTVGIGWIPKPYWFTPFLTLWNFSFLYSEPSLLIIFALVVMIISLGVGLWQAKYRPQWFALIALWMFFPPAIILAISLGRTSFYVDRYFLIITPILTILIASGLLSLPGRFLSLGITLFYITVTSVGLGRAYFDVESFSKEDWRTLAIHLDERVNPNGVVITCTDGQWLAFEYYNPHQRLSPQQVIFAAQVPDISIDIEQAWVIDMHESSSSMHYLAKSEPLIPDRSLLSSDMAVWEANNLKDVIQVSGINAYQYDVSTPQQLINIVEWYCQN